MTDGWYLLHWKFGAKKERVNRLNETGGRERKIESKSLFKNARLLKRIS